MPQVKETILDLYNKGVLLEDIQRETNLPLTSVVDIIFKAKTADMPDNAILRKKSNWYIYFCEFMFENKSIKDIMVGRSVKENDVIEMIGNVIKLDAVSKPLREATIDKIAKETGETSSVIAKRFGVEYSKSFATTIRRLWR